MTEEIVEPVAGFRGWPRVAMWVAHAGFFVVGMALASFFATSLWATKPILGVMGFFVIAVASWKVLDLASTYLPRFRFIAGIYAAVFGVIGLPVAAIFGLVAAGIWILLDGDGGTKFATDRPAFEDVIRAPDRRMADECYEVLFPEEYEIQVHRIRFDARSYAHDIATEALVSTCEKHNHEPKRNLQQYYSRVVRNRLADWKRRPAVLDRCDAFEVDRVENDDVFSGEDLEEY